MGYAQIVYWSPMQGGKWCQFLNLRSKSVLPTQPSTSTSILLFMVSSSTSSSELITIVPISDSIPSTIVPEFPCSIIVPLSVLWSIIVPLSAWDIIVPSSCWIKVSVVPLPLPLRIRVPESTSWGTGLFPVLPRLTMVPLSCSSSWSCRRENGNKKVLVGVNWN